MTNVPRHNHTDDTFELLSGYVDDALDVVERRRADSLLRECRACVVELEELRMLRQALRALPMPVPKRSFTLDPARVRPRMRFFPILRFAALVSALLLVVVLGVDVFGGVGTPPQAATSLEAPAAAPAPAQEQAAVAEATAAAGEAAPAAGGAAAMPTEEAMSAAAAAPADPTLAAQDARKVPEASPEAYEAADPAAAGDAQNAAPASGTTADTAADALPLPAGSGGGLGGVSALTTSDTSAQDTTTLEQPEALPGGARDQQPANPWRWAELILAVLVAVLASATWWTARQRL